MDDICSPPVPSGLFAFLLLAPDGGALRLRPDTNPPHAPIPPTQEVQNIEEVRTTFGLNLAPKAPEFFFEHTVGG